MLYSSVDNKKIKDIKKLYQKKYRDLEDSFIVEGEHLVLEAYKTGYLKCLVLTENTYFPFDIETIYVTEHVMKYLTDMNSPTNMIGICTKLKEHELGDRILILDNLQDPGNLGTIIRSAVAFNVSTIILSKDTVDIYNSKVVRSSQGLIFHINIIICDILEEIAKLKELQYKVLGTKVTGGMHIKDIDNKDKIALVMGNEGNGVKEEVLDLCDSYIYIDMNEKCESLNVGVAASIILYELDK